MKRVAVSVGFVESRARCGREAKDNIDMEERLEWNVIGRQPFQSICVSGLIFEIFGSV